MKKFANIGVSEDRKTEFDRMVYGLAQASGARVTASELLGMALQALRLSCGKFGAMADKAREVAMATYQAEARELEEAPPIGIVYPLVLDRLGLARRSDPLLYAVLQGLEQARLDHLLTRVTAKEEESHG